MADWPELTRDGLAHRRRDLSPEELNGAKDRGVRHGADTELGKEALVTEKLVLEKNLVDHLLRVADEQRPPW